jgi:hypothetical protein
MFSASLDHSRSSQANARWRRLPPVEKRETDCPTGGKAINAVTSTSEGGRARLAGGTVFVLTLLAGGF